MNLRKWEHNTASSAVHECPIRGPGKTQADIESARPAVYGQDTDPLTGYDSGFLTRVDDVLLASCL